MFFIGMQGDFFEVTISNLLNFSVSVNAVVGLLILLVLFFLLKALVRRRI